MKKIIFISALALTLSSASMAMASLSSDIRSMGMCKAVANAVSRGTTVSMIIGQSRGMSQADQKTLFTALYSAGANDDTIRISAEKAKISDLILMEAFNASNNQGCVDNRTPPAPAAATPVVAATTPPVAQEASASQTASQTAPSAASAPVAVTPVATTPVATTPVAVTPVAATPPASGKTLPHLKAILPLKANSQSLTSEGKAALAHFVRKFKNIGQGKIEVRGYVSSSTSSKGNTQRSIERAEAVQAMLISAGVDRASIVTRGMGIENPVASNKTSTGRDKNRRVELEMIDAGNVVEKNTPVTAASTPPAAQEASASQTASQTAPETAPPVTSAPEAATPVAVPPPASASTLPRLKAILPLKANSQSLTSEGKAALANFIRKFKNIEQGKIEVRGYVSSSESSKANTQRSIDRAEAVQAMLISAGVDRASIVTRGMGIKNPVASNKTTTGRDKNRRVELEIIP